MRLFSAIALATLLSTLICATVLAETRAPGYAIIVHPSNESTVLDRKFLEDAFLKKVTRWPSDVVIRPVDQPGGAPVRRSFSEDVLHRSVDAVKGYWQQRIFSGRDVPPPEFQRDEEGVQFVLKHEGGLGYVSGTADVEGCRVLVVR